MVAVAVQPPAFQLRLGLVLFGGVSLAIYMNGMVQELLALARAAHARQACRLGRPQPNWIAEMRYNPYWDALDAAGADVLIDVIAGASAGGLNGMLLAKALAVGAPDLQSAGVMWEERAQIDRMACPDSNESAALLSGVYMETELAQALGDLSRASRPELADQAEVLDLFITATDVRGYRWTDTEIDVFGDVIEGRRHDVVFHLKKRSSRQGRGYDCNDFAASDPSLGLSQQERDRLLARLACATAAFPGALPPVYLDRADLEAAGISVLETGRRGAWFSDGGILANKPFSPVIRTIFERSADQPVERVLLYLDPRPPSFQTGDGGEDRAPHLLEMVAAPFLLPFNQDIQEHLAELKSENRRRQSLLEALQASERELGRSPGAAPAGSRDAAALRGYRQMRLALLERWYKDTLTAALTRLRDPQPEETAASVWRHMRALAPDTRRLLACYDPSYHRRRLHYLLSLLHREYRQGAKSPSPAHMSALQKGLWTALEDWREAEWQLANLGTEAADRTWQAAHLVAALAAARYDQGRAAARVLLCHLDAVQRQAGACERNALLAAVRALPLEVPAPRRPSLTADLICRMAGDFEPHDVVLFPLRAFGVLSEWDIITTGRLSPGATRWVRRPAEEKLAGIRAAHFGAFFHQPWRQNDRMWGRLDAAELLGRLIVQQAGSYVPDQAALAAAVEQAVMRRRRQILQDAAAVLDLSCIARLAGVTPERLSPGTLANAALVPDAALQRYLQEHHQVGEQGWDAVPPRRLAAVLLVLLHNLVQAAGRPPVGSPRWVWALQSLVMLGLRPLAGLARYTLAPLEGLLATLQQSLVCLMGAAGTALLSLHLAGALTLGIAGWLAVGLLLLPLLSNLLFRPPGLLQLGVTAALALLSLAGNLLLWIGAVEPALGPVGQWLLPVLLRATPLLLGLWTVQTLARLVWRRPRN